VHGDLIFPHVQNVWYIVRVGKFTNFNEISTCYMKIAALDNWSVRPILHIVTVQI